MVKHKAWVWLGVSVLALLFACTATYSAVTRVSGGDPISNPSVYEYRLQWIANTDIAFTVNLPRGFKPEYMLWQWEDIDSDQYYDASWAISAYQDEEVLYFIPSDRGLWDLQSYQVSVYRDAGDTANVQQSTYSDIMFYETTF